jgi:hypothetical protein
MHPGLASPLSVPQKNFVVDGREEKYNIEK